jgi:mycothiol system anti-sigma-R factor
MNCEEARELITALIDNEVSDLERSLIEDHLQDCSSCLRAYEQERALKKEIHRIGLSIGAPAELKRKILADHGTQPIERKSLIGWSKIALNFCLFQRPALGLALVFIILLPVIYLLQPRSQAISLAALGIQEKIAGGEISLRKPASQNELRDWQTRAVDGRFAPMEYDFPSFHVVGGTVEEINGRKVLVSVYAGDHNSITCFTFLGTEQDSPRDATRFFDEEKDATFYTFARNGYNAVLHREGDVICLLASKLPLNDLLAMARKAQPA